MSILDEIPEEALEGFKKKLQEVYDELKEILLDERKALEALHCLFWGRFPRDKGEDNPEGK